MENDIGIGNDLLGGLLYGLKGTTQTSLSAFRAQWLGSREEYIYVLVSGDGGYVDINRLVGHCKWTNM